MKLLLNKETLNNLKSRLTGASRILLFIDYDSILSPESSNDVNPLELQEREHLRELSEKNALTLAIVSNYSLVQLKKIIGFSGIYFIANNGMEISGPDLNVIHGEAKRVRNELESLIEKMDEHLKNLHGITMDNRGFSISLNITKAKPLIQRRTRMLMEEIWTPIMDSFTLFETRNEIIIRPRVGWGKSRAVMFVWNKFSSPRRRPFVIYVGADENDEEIYTHMGREGLGVVVGGPTRIARSKAGYQLKNRLEIDKFIVWLTQHTSQFQTPNVPGL